MVSVDSVVLQQVSSTFAQANARKTLNKPILLKYLPKYLSPDQFAQIESVCTDGYVYIWGSKDERSHQYGKIRHRWSLALFRRGKTVIKCGLIAMWIHNPDLAKFLWGCDGNNQTWSFIYFLKDVKELSVPASAINRLLGRKAADNWQGLTAVTSPATKLVYEFVKAQLGARSDQG